MSLDANKEAVRQFHRAVFVERQMDTLPSLMIDPLHDVNASGVPEPLDHLKGTLQTIFGAFPDLKAAVDDVMGEGEIVTLRLTLTGTHGGNFMGAAPTGKPFSVSAIHIFRFADSKIVERWEWVDRLGLRAQLGIQ
ncbi:MAG: ester cyclase [Chloroflexota bacterium]|nr:ester cyclase [Chloroflexota bacterium]